MGPAIIESGVKILAEFMITEALDRDGPAQMIMIAEFPDEKACKKIYESELFLNHKNQRDHVLTYLSEGFFRVTEDGEFNIGGDGVLEIASLWSKANGKANGDAYFQAGMLRGVQAWTQYGLSDLSQLPRRVVITHRWCYLETGKRQKVKTSSLMAKPLSRMLPNAL